MVVKRRKTVELRSTDSRGGCPYMKRGWSAATNGPVIRT